MTHEKSRHLAPFVYFEIIQKEYVICELRSKIFPRRNKERHVFRDREYYKNVMKGKKEKIEDFGMRNRMPTIFDNEKVRLQITEELIPVRGLPEFIYRDDEERRKLRPLDKKFYYSKSSSVKVFYNVGDNDFEVGEIKSYDAENNIVKVRIRNTGEIKTVSCDNVCRIL